MKQKIEQIRNFGGETQFQLDYSTPEKLAKSKKERHFNQRMLRAYLNGKQYFYFGYEWVNGRRQQVRYSVLTK